MGRAERITKEVKKHDYKLFCAENKEGKLCIYRQSSRIESYYLDEETVILYARPSPHFIFALTDNWKPTGRPVERGVLPILERLQRSDLWNHNIAEKCIQDYKDNEKSLERQRRNITEDVLADEHSKFKSMFADINTGSMSKRPKIRKRIKEI